MGKIKKTFVILIVTMILSIIGLWPAFIGGKTKHDNERSPLAESCCLVSGDSVTGVPEDFIVLPLSSLILGDSVSGE